MRGTTEWYQQMEDLGTDTWVVMLEDSQDCELVTMVVRNEGFPKALIDIADQVGCFVGEAEDEGVRGAVRSWPIDTSVKWLARLSDLLGNYDDFYISFHPVNQSYLYADS